MSYIVVIDGNVQGVHKDVGNVINLLTRHEGARAWSIELDDGVPAVAGEVLLGDSREVQVVREVGLVDEDGDVLGTGRVKTDING